MTKARSDLDSAHERLRLIHVRLWSSDEDNPDLREEVRDALMATMCAIDAIEDRLSALEERCRLHMRNEMARANR